MARAPAAASLSITFAWFARGNGQRRPRALSVFSSTWTSTTSSLDNAPSASSSWYALSRCSMPFV